MKAVIRLDKIAELLLTAVLAASLLCAAAMPSFAVTQEEKDAATKAAEEAKAASEAKKAEAKELAKKAAEAVSNFEEAEAQLDQIAGEIEAIKIDIGNKEAEISGTISQIESTKAEIRAKEADIEEQNNSLNNRLTAMYKTGNSGFVDVILNSDNVEDLLSNIGMVHKILESDQKLLKNLKKEYKKLQKIKDELEAEEAVLRDQQVALEGQQLTLEGKEYETEELKKKYKAQADEMHALQAQKEAEAAEMAAEAAAMQAEAEAMIVESGGQIEIQPGEYAWPTASNWELSDKYGWRICPFHGKEFHNGLDIVLSSGTNGSPVYAIADGYITRASWYGGYGNCIQYAIGNNYSVLCGHLKGFNCKKGQFVKKGTVIGYIGSTGASTGPHLHFTVFQNGSTINPFSLY